MALRNLMQGGQRPERVDGQRKIEYYSGQWTKEEQDYVTCLVDGFKRGSLDIPDGTSLRFFIAAKLGCKPKRVSKKYERSGYNGKQVYRRDSNLTKEEQDAYRQRLKTCEKNFTESRALVVAMQGSKSGSISPSASGARCAAPVPTETPVITLGSTTSRSSTYQLEYNALEDRLAAMRNQIDQATAALAHNCSSTAYAAPSTFSTLELRQALIMQRQRNAAATAYAASIHGYTAFHQPPASSDKVLIDLYQHRQQLLLARMTGDLDLGGIPMSMGASAVPLPTASTTLSSLSPLAFQKRLLIDLEIEERARKRARAA